MKCKPCPNPNDICSCIHHPNYLKRKRISTSPIPAMKRIITEIAEEHEIDPGILSKPTRKKQISSIRKIAIERCRKETNATLEQIGEVFKRNHSTILYALKEIR